MSSKEYSHLNDLSQLSFLVIDEADRMIKQGSFPQLQKIFEAINDANPPPPDEVEGDEDSEDDDDDNYDRLKGIGGVRGEARVVMLNDSILAAIENEREGGVKMRGRDVPPPAEMDDEEYERQLRRSMRDAANAEKEEEELERTVVHRQTFVYSATLTLPPSMHHLIKKDLAAKIKTKRRRKGNNKQPTTVDGAIAEILEIAGARGETKVVDLSNVGGSTPKNKRDAEKESKTVVPAKASVNDGPSSSLLTRLPPGLTLGEIRCAQRHKDSHLYAYLVTTRQGSSGPCLVFCNSIAAVRRVGETLKTLGLPVKMLHAQMAQVSFV
jgi:ATP-dependent RNA helicase DDX24/MAK5